MNNKLCFTLDSYIGCNDIKCQECCPHDERDHGICLDCDHEEDPGVAVDRAMDYFDHD